MSQVGQLEGATQVRVIQLLKRLGYVYLGNWEKRAENSNVEVALLKAALKGKYKQVLIDKAVAKFEREVKDRQQKLYDLNKAIYGRLRYGMNVKASADQPYETVYLVDWKNPASNHFAFAEEVTVDGRHTKRPDIVLYVNGIALGVLELKRSKVSVLEGIRQNLDNQKPEFIERFFGTVQLVMAGNDTEGLRYGTIGTPEKYYLKWKEPQADGDKDYTIYTDPEITAMSEGRRDLLDQHLIQVCEPKRLLELVHDFVVYDRGIKKVCRPNQYFGVKAAQAQVKKRQGGIIWHTQGSGKSLTMVWLTKWIKENVDNARILIITDRDELDKQIEKVFKGVGENIVRTKSGRDLLQKLNETLPILLCSLIHKFGKRQEGSKKAEEQSYDEYIKAIKRDLPSNFRAKGDLYVFIDECHRTQSGKLHAAMKELLPNALLIGFTGTPLLKKDKQTSIEVFGGYIHTYKFNEAVADKVVLDLLYEARDVEQYIGRPKKIDQWFEAKTQGLTDYAKAKLKERWGTMQKVLSSRSRLSQIVDDIILDMATKPLLQNGRGNAMLVSGSIYEACKYYELFLQKGFSRCAIITSYAPKVSDIKGESTGEEALTEKLKQYEIYKDMLSGEQPEDFERKVKEQFIDEPAQIKLLIVVDKLLTGFDAPSATYLYIDKRMRDHGLFQAICRVNRLGPAEKEYGYVVDYKDLFKSLERSIQDYTTEAFGEYEQDDVGGLLKERLTTLKKRLDNALEDIELLCEPVAAPKDTQDYIAFFCGDTSKTEDLADRKASRHQLYQYANALVRAYANLANEMSVAGYTEQERQHIFARVEHYKNVSEEMKIASDEYIDLKAYEPAMRHLIDSYVKAEESEVLYAFEDMTLMDVIVNKGLDEAVKTLPESIRKRKESVAETIENNMRSTIVEKQAANPKYYERMSKLLQELVLQRKEATIAYEAYLRKIAALAKEVQQPENTSYYPLSLKTIGQRALFDFLEEQEELTLKVNEAIMTTKKDDWRSTHVKRRMVKMAIKKVLPASFDLDKLFEVVMHRDSGY